MFIFQEKKIMSDFNSMSRENKKQRLRQRVVTNPAWSEEKSSSGGQGSYLSLIHISVFAGDMYQAFAAPEFITVCIFRDGQKNF